MWSDSYVGLRFKDRGRARDGLDCWGLVRLVLLEQCHITLPMMTTEREETDVLSLRALRFPDVPLSDAQCFDCALVNVPLQVAGVWVLRPRHIGVFVNRTQVLHINENSLSRLDAVASLDIHTIKRVVGYHAA